MNNENVFFNPGDAIASSHDFKEARRSAQIIKADKPTAGQIVIAQMLWLLLLIWLVVVIIDLLKILKNK